MSAYAGAALSTNTSPKGTIAMNRPVVLRAFEALPLLCLLSATSCAAPDDSAPADNVETRRLNQPTGWNLWPNHTISVCWTSATFNDSTLDTFRDNARIWIAESISEAANLKFTDWDECPSSPTNRISITVNSSSPNSNGGDSDGGAGYRGSSSVMTVSLGQDALSAATGQGVVIHELMHRIGFGHEFNRPRNQQRDATGKLINAGIDCDWQFAQPGDTHGTPYDHDSILNDTYCGTWNNLSYWDVIGLRDAYGSYENSKLASFRNADGRLEVVYAGTGDVLYHRWQNDPGGAWSRPALLGAPTNEAKQVTLSRNTDGRLEAFYIGTDDRIYHNWQESAGGVWSGEFLLGNSASYAKQLTVGVNDDGRLELVFIGTDDVLYHRWQDSPGGAWSAEDVLVDRGVTAKNLALGENSDGRLEAVFVGLNDVVYHSWQGASTATGWADPSPLGSTDNLAKRVDVATNADGRLEVVTVGTDDVLYHFWQDEAGGGWSAETLLSTSSTTASQIALTTNQDGRLELVYTSPSNKLYHIWQTSPGGAWSDAAYLGTPDNAAKKLSVNRNSDGRLEAFYIGTDNVLYHNWQDSAGGAWAGENDLLEF